MICTNNIEDRNELVRITGIAMVFFGIGSVLALNVAFAIMIIAGILVFRRGTGRIECGMMMDEFPDRFECPNCGHVQKK